MSLSKERIKYLRKLQQKKYRQREGKFVVERWKNISAFLDKGYEPLEIWAMTPPPAGYKVAWQPVSAAELKRISALQHPYDALAVFALPRPGRLRYQGLILALDGIADPGNLGTIIRTADWFGIRQIVCSPGTVDAYNPKTVQAAMGALAQVNIHYTDLVAFLRQAPVPVYGTDMQGRPVFAFDWPRDLIVVMGNEGHGLSAEVKQVVAERLTIPGHRSAVAESLNVAVASAVLMAEYFRYFHF